VNDTERETRHALEPHAGTYRKSAGVKLPSKPMHAFRAFYGQFALVPPTIFQECTEIIGDVN
jgi:hypothetical protein